MTYTAETIRTLETADMNIFHKITGKMTLYDREGNEDIRRQSEVENIKDWTQTEKKNEMHIFDKRNE